MNVSSTANLVGHMGSNHRLQPAIEPRQPVGEGARSRHRHHAIGDMAQPVAIHGEDAPAGDPQTGIEDLVVLFPPYPMIFLLLPRSPARHDVP